MILNKFIEGLQSFVEENPEARNYIVVTSKDDEGNGFSEVYYKPSLGEYDGEDFMQNEENGEPRDINAVCVN